MRRARPSARFGSPPSSPVINLTGWPFKPPRAFTSETQARAAGSRGTSCWPMGPDSVPTEPSTMVDFGPEETGAGIGGVGSWVPGWGVATCAGGAGDDGAAGFAPPTRGTGVAPGATALTGRP